MHLSELGLEASLESNRTLRESASTRRWGALVFGILLAACGDDDGAPDPEVDAAIRDAGRDANRSEDGGGDLPDAGGTDARATEGLREVVVASGSNHWRALSIDGGRTFCDVGRATEADATGFDNPYLLRTISFYDGRFVTGSWRAIYVSTNGFEWTDVTGDGNPAFGQWVAGIAYGNDWWVATGGYGTAMRSRDLTTWENVSSELPGNEASRSLVFGDGVFVTGRDSVGWWSSADGTGWTQIDPDNDPALVFDGTVIERPGYDRGHGIRLRGGWPNRIERAEDREGATWETVYTAPENPTRFAFGEVPEADFTRGRVPDALADCLGL
ncbi:MAG: hypothetical protein H6721_10915 [Sandaracinus sp.]|nr:hypothetical protein [Sandaracinus sp.]